MVMGRGGTNLDRRRLLRGVGACLSGVSLAGCGVPGGGDGEEGGEGEKGGEAGGEDGRLRPPGG